MTITGNGSCCVVTSRSEGVSDIAAMEKGECEEAAVRMVHGHPERVTFALAVAAELVSGTPYAFSAIGPQLLQRFGYTSTQTGMVATGGCLGLYLSGPLFGYLVDKHGPNRVFVAASVMGCLGYLLMALAYFGALHHTHFLALGAYFGLAGLASSAANSAALATVVRSVPEARRGIAVGVCVSFFGLSAFVFSRIRQAWLPAGHGDGQRDMTGWYLVALAASLGAVNIVAALFLRDPTRRRRQYEELQGSANGGSTANGFPSIGQLHPTQALFLKSPWAIFLFANFALLTMAGLLMINSMGQVVVAIYGMGADTATVQNLHVSILSLANCAGRLLHGIGSDWAASKWGTPRLAALVVAAVMQFVGHGLIAIGDGRSLPWVYTALIGLGYGGAFSIVPTLVGDWFGLRSFATNWGWMTWAPAAGTQVSALVFGYVYDSHAVTPGVCEGPQCFRAAFVATALCCAVSAMVLSIEVMAGRPRHSVLSLQ